MTEQRLRLGQWGEAHAVSFLKKKGMKILACNYRCKAGEIDIIACNKKYLVFAEVKTRRTVQFGTPQEAVGPHKQRQIYRASQWYLLQHQIGNLQPRFDVLGVLWQSWDAVPKITHIEDAFSVFE